MSAWDLIHQAKARGITLLMVGDKLKLSARVGLITPEIKTELRSHKAEILEVLRELADKPKTKVYHVIVETDGVHKHMTVIDSSGEDLAGFRRSCCNRFGPERLISIEPPRQ